METLKHTIALFIAVLGFAASAHAEGESRETAIPITEACTKPLMGEADKNTTTWFVIEPASFADNDLVTVSVIGNNYGDIIFYEEGAQSEMTMIGTDKGYSAKKLWISKNQPVYVAVTQDGPGASASFALSVASPGETRFNAITVADGTSEVNSNCFPVWCVYTASASKVVTIKSTAGVGNAIDFEGHNVCMANDMLNGFRMQQGSTVYFPVNSSAASVTIELSEPQEGYYADMPLNITGKSEFTIDLLSDPNANKDSAAQSERYWIYEADKSGFLMWGTADKDWQEGMWGCGINDTTTHKRLNTPETKIQAGMVTYTIPVEAGHVYLISPTVCYSQKARQVTLYTTFIEPEMGDTKDNPIALTLNDARDLGRVISLTKYYAFTAEKTGTYTATVHAGGQVRATTPQDGSWNIGRDYSIQDLQMHIDDEINLAAGETLLLEVTLTSDIDIHTDGSDASKPNYSILITLNDGGDTPAPDVREGEDIAHAIEAEPGVAYAVMLSSDENYYDKYYKIVVPANDTLLITTLHPEGISSPACINFTLDGAKWNVVKSTSTFIKNEDGTKNIGRLYVVEPSDAVRTIYVETDGVSFLYEGMTWSYDINVSSSEDGPVNIKSLHSEGAAAIYMLNGVKVDGMSAPGVYVIKSNGSSRKVIVK